MRLISGLLLLTLAMACGKKDKDSGASPAEDGAGKLEASELAAPANISTMSQTVLTDEFVSAPFLISRTAVPTIGCSAEQISQTTISAAGNTLKVSRTVNTAPCYVDFLNGVGGVGTTVTASASVYSEIVCKDVDVSRFNGTKAQDFDPNTVCVNGYTFLENMRSSSDAQSTVDGTPLTFIYRSVAARSTADNQPCTVSIVNNLFSETGCIEIETAIDTGTQAYVDFTTRTHKDLVWGMEPDVSWYTSGSMDLVVNNWTGSITYAGAAVNPSYSLSNGTNTVTGTFTAAAFKALSQMKSPFKNLGR